MIKSLVFVLFIRSLNFGMTTISTKALQVILTLITLLVLDSQRNYSLFFVFVALTLLSVNLLN
jgi:hypothetical protein